MTYGTVTDIPGETSKCWITRNLGATQQPNTVDDDTEAAAGWYWQFNRKQGYKHDGTTLTPAWSITGITEDFDWESANDPCNLLLGNAWRVPTMSEWINVNTAGNWVNWNGPWSSGLQMHAAGRLLYSSGSLTYRGSHGTYWSSSDTGNNGGLTLWFNSLGTNITIGYNKAMGNPIRCLRD